MRLHTKYTYTTNQRPETLDLQDELDTTLFARWARAAAHSSSVGRMKS
jgi:hypothetical protein